MKRHLTHAYRKLDVRHRTRLLTLVQPGHYVLTEEVNAGWVTVWDPSGKVLGEGSARRYPRPEWDRVWAGVALQVSSNSMP